MGRKSRRSDAAVPAIADKPLEIFPTAIYARLSVENSGKDDDGAAIATQIEICREYIQSKPDLQLVKIYQDNGYTGTTMTRPAFTQMWEDIKCGLIKSIVVRDLSRYSRNYIETGTHLEKEFPKYDVRFISVKEEFDTFTTDGTAESLMIPLQSLINDFYSKDISRKVEAALHTQMEEGTFNWRKIPYGYKWNEDKTNIVPDEKTADVIRLIFQWRMEGVSKTEISNRLDDMKAPLADDGYYNRNGLWAISTISNILSNPAYAGDRVYGVRHSAIYKGIKMENVPEEDWYVIPNAHEAIIDRETFDSIKSMMKEASQKRKSAMEKSAKDRAKFVDLFAGKLFCADCRRKLLFHKSFSRSKNPYWYAYYHCSYSKSRAYDPCTAHYIRQEVINDIVLKAIQTQVKTAMDYEVLLEKLRNSDMDRSFRDKLNACVQSAQQKIRGLQSKRTRLYEDYTEGLLDEQEYNFARESYNTEYEKLNKLLDDLIVRRSEYQEAMSADNKWITLMKSVRNCRKLTQELVDTVVDKVKVNENKDVELIVRYHDVYEMTVRYADELRKEADKNG